MNANTRRLVESAILIALAAVLSLIKFFQMPLGGSLTLCSMLPIMLIGYKYGVKWGVLSAFTYSIVQILLDLGQVLSWGMTWQAVAASFLLDYILAFSSLGLAGVYGRGFGKYVAGMVTAVFCRFVFHVVSGTVIFASWMPKTWHNPFLYSVAYNGGFLLPDLALCLIAGCILYKPLRRYIEA